MIKIIIIFGTRPEAIKLAPLISAFQKDNRFNLQTCNTGQHKEMLDQVLDLFNIIPNYNLSIMKKNQNLFSVTAEILTGLQSILEKSDPDIVLVHGDTTTTFAAALAAYYKKIPVAHIEAGLRTGDIYSPWPEEGNRRLTASISKYHFPPTQASMNNLLKEGVQKKDILVTGNTVIDAMFWAIEILNQKPELIEDMNRRYSFLRNKKKIILITGHRRESFGNGFERICSAIKEISNLYPNVEFVYPVHLNPNVSNPVNRLLSGNKNIHLIKPLEYLSFVYLMSRAYIVLTDSGGIQEEAPSLGKPVLVMRDKTERPEAINIGTVKMVGTKADVIVSELKSLLDNKEIYKKMSEAHNPYGDGKACKRIVDFLAKF
jgi:UDP-N-acetylglucosamine 2-epimerase (non-hydrolysing)